MKSYLKIQSIIVIFSMLLSSCDPQITQVGSVNMISTRNVENTDYELLSTYMGGNKKELLKTRATTIEEAVNQTVKSVPGGEYLKNVKIFKVENSYYAVEGDVWGVQNSDVSYRGFKIGDMAIYEESNGGSKVILHKGKITGFRDENNLYFEELGTKQVYIAAISKIAKSAITLADETTQQSLPSKIEEILLTEKNGFILNETVFHTNDWVSNKKVTIVKLSDSTLDIKESNGTVKTVKYNHIKKIDESKNIKEEEKFKIGDKVRWDTFSGDIYQGKISEILENEYVIVLSDNSLKKVSKTKVYKP